MKTILPSMIVAILAMGATPAFSDEAWQAFECELLGEHTEDDVIDVAEEWLAAARTLPGGKEMGLRILIPHAAASREIDFLFVLSAPSFEAWGKFWDNYAGSKAHEIDEKSNAITNCPSSRLYESVRIEPK